jgi:lipoprotein-anchoring transpeptidase ErfK/SrfK
MRTRLIILVAFIAFLGLGGVAGAYFYDRSKQDLVAEGVRVNGVPIGGLDRAQAERKLSAVLLEPLDRPVKVRYHDRTFTLSQKAAAIGIDIRGSVDKALQRSQEGSMFSRAWRNLRNESVDTELAANVSWNEPSIGKLVKRVRKAIERDPVDAKVDLTKGNIDESDSRTGLRVKYNTLAKDVERTLLDPGNTQTVKVRTTVVQPKVTTEQLAEKYPAVMIVNRKTFKLELYKGLEHAKTYNVAVGKVGLETPAGLYTIQNKAENPAWHVPDSDWAGDLAGKVIPGDDPSNPIKARWMGIYDGVGVHGTDDDASIGSQASHGCIRMHIPDVKELYDQVPVGTPIYIGDGPTKA